jgi:hypothetical protein
MSLVTATFIVNNTTNKGRFVKNLPEDYQFAPFERLVSRQISKSDYDLLDEDNYQNIKVYRYVDTPFVDKKKPPKGLDFKIGLTTRLYENPYINSFGFLEKMDYYAKSTFNPVTKSWDFSDKVITEDYNYTIDPATKYVVARTKIVTWYKEDDTPHLDKKFMFKPYTFLEMEEEAIRRRSNIISILKIELAKFGNFVIESQFPNSNNKPDSNEIVKKISAPLNTAIRSYIDAGDKETLINKVNESKDPFFNYHIPWLNMTPKELIISKVS